MKRMMAAATAMAALLALGATSAQAQDDDWEFAEDTEQKLTVAAARYEGGQMIAAQCRRGSLGLIITGLPEGAEMLRLAATRADGRAVAQIWLPAGVPGVYRSASPARDVRFLRGGGGAYVFQGAAGEPTTASGTFELPTRSANLDRVLTTCGWALEDDRDLLAEAEVLLDRPRRGRDAPPYRPPPAPEREVSCVVRQMRLRDCRPDHPSSAGASGARAVIRAVEGREVYAPIGTDPAASEGRVFHVLASNQLLLAANR